MLTLKPALRAFKCCSPTSFIASFAHQQLLIIASSLNNRNLYCSSLSADGTGGDLDSNNITDLLNEPGESNEDFGFEHTESFRSLSFGESLNDLSFGYLTQLISRHNISSRELSVYRA